MRHSDAETRLPAPMTDADRPEESPEDRVPCTDDMCVGIIGPNGTCGVCGRPGTPSPGPARPEHPHDDLHGAPARAPEPEPEPEPEPDERVPCLDDMCVGILSPQRKCGTCGRTWTRARPG
jgi:hypothetical protein